MTVLRDWWRKWKMLRLPWRKTFLVGQDLQGNTFWEFKDTFNANRLRRIVRHGRTPHMADVQITPQWHQWLRHTRHQPPSLQEQQADLGRQAQLKVLAQQADERWQSKPSFLDRPREAPKPATLPKDQGGYASQTVSDEQMDRESTAEAPAAEQEASKPGNVSNPWKPPQRGGPSQKWQPESWAPGPVKKR